MYPPLPHNANETGDTSIGILAGQVELEKQPRDQMTYFAYSAMADSSLVEMSHKVRER